MELPQVQNPRVDLLARMESGRLTQVELDGFNDMTPLRMLGYLYGIWSKLGKIPRQVLIYVGDRRLRLRRGHTEEGLNFRYEVIDFRELDGEAMLRRDSVAMNVLSVLAGLDEPEDAVRRIIMKIAGLESPEARADALRKLLIVAGLRGLEEFVEEKSREMPITQDIMDHKVLGPAIRKGIDQGRQEGLQEGERQILRLLLEKRFGPLPDWAGKRLEECTAREAEALALRLLDSGSLEELFG